MTRLSESFGATDSYRYSDSSLNQQQTASKSTTETSNHAVKLDEWHIRKGEEVAEKLGLANMPKNYEQQLADFHCVMFEEDFETQEETTAEKRKKFITEYTNTTEYEELHVSTQYDSFSSFIATKAMLLAYGRLEDDADEEQIRKQAKDALNEGSKLVEEGEAMQQALGTGGGIGDHDDESTDEDIEAKLKMFEEVRHNTQLRLIMEAAGRFRRAAQSMQRSRLAPGTQELGDLGLGGDVRKLTASERLRLGCGIPEIEDMTALKVLAKTALERKRVSPEPIGRGPIIIFCDESGSMREDDRIVSAKAMTLALLWIAKQQKRSVALCGFRRASHWLVFEDGIVPESDLLRWLQRGPAGGTSSSPILEECQQVYQNHDWCKDADIITITDGNMAATDYKLARFNEWRESVDVKHQVIAVGVEQMENSVIEKMSDSCSYVKLLSVGQGNQSVENIFANI